MSEMDIMKGLSDLDGELIMKPRKFVPLGHNALFCFLAANVSGAVPGRGMGLHAAVFLLVFYGLYLLDMRRLNRRRRKKLLIEPEEPEK